MLNVSALSTYIFIKYKKLNSSYVLGWVFQAATAFDSHSAYGSDY